MSIGEQLRQSRLAQDISLDQVSQATHIRLHFLEAIEAGQFDLLPSAVQLRGFIRAYGDYLKLNSQELIQTLERDFRDTSTSTVQTLAVTEPSPAASSSEVIFKELGHKLRSQRELMGLSLGDVERHTHIRMHYVRALEEGDISHLPSPVQGRGMLSNYATFLGLNTEAVLLQFADGLQASLYDRQAERNKGVAKSQKNASPQTPARPSQLRRLFSMDLFAGGILIFFLLGFTIWGALRISALRKDQLPSPTAPPVSEILLSTQGNNISATPNLPTGSVSTVVLTGIPASTIITGTLEVDQAATSVVYEPTPGKANAPLQVYVIAQRSVWMRIIVDGETAFEGRVISGSAYSFSGNEYIEFLTGDGGGLQVFYNQQDLGFLGAYGEVVERTFSITGIQTATPGVLPTRTMAPSSTPTPSITPARPGSAATPTATPKP